MWWTSLLRWPKSDSSRTLHRRRRPKRHQGRLFVPRLDVLEDRTLPSTFTVLNLHDSGPGSLRQAILDANAHPGADTVRFVHLRVLALNVEHDHGSTVGRCLLNDYLGRIRLAGADRAEDSQVARQNSLVLALQAEPDVLLS
jgi:hypothetical protein